MKLDVSKLKSGARLRPVKGGGGYAGWYPHVTVLEAGTDEEGVLPVRFSNGRESRCFNPNGGMQFEIMPPLQMENK